MVPSPELAAVAAETLRALREMPPQPEGLPGSLVGPAADTLAFVVRVVAEDAATGADRLADPAFLGKCLVSYRWVPDVERPGERIRLTRYLVDAVEGSPERTATYDHALYALPDDESGLDAATAEGKRDTLLRYRYTRQDVAAGVYETGEGRGRATPLVWLTWNDHEQALMQGTIAVTLPDGSTRLYNVHRNNGIAYVRSETDTKKQRRYWYFRELEAVRGWAAEPVQGPALRAQAAVAGDLKQLGFGRLVLLQTDDGVRLVVLADTGGAFEGNLHQLDLYSGIFPSRAAFAKTTGPIGDTAAAWVVGVAPECR